MQQVEETKVKKSENTYLTTLFIPKLVKTTLTMTIAPRCHVATWSIKNPIIVRRKVPPYNATSEKRSNKSNRGPCYHSHQIIHYHVNRYHKNAEYKGTPIQNSKIWCQNNTSTCARPQFTIVKQNNIIRVIRTVDPLHPVGPYQVGRPN